MITLNVKLVPKRGKSVEQLRRYPRKQPVKFSVRLDQSQHVIEASDYNELLQTITVMFMFGNTTFDLYQEVNEELFTFGSQADFDLVRDMRLKEVTVFVLNI